MEIPLVAGAIHVTQAIVVDQFAGVFGHAVTLEVVRRTAYGGPGMGNLLRDEAGILKPRNADGKIEGFVRQIEDAIVEGQGHFDVGVLPHIIRHRRRQMENAEGCRRGHPQNAARLGLELAGGQFGFFDFGEDMTAAVAISHADLGQAEPARGPVEQPDPKLIFQAHHVLGDHRPRHPELFRCHREAARLGHPHENPHAGQLVHYSVSCLIVSDLETKLILKMGLYKMVHGNNLCSRSGGRRSQPPSECLRNDA